MQIILNTIATVNMDVESYRSGFFRTLFLPETDKQILIIANTIPSIGMNKLKIPQIRALTLWGADSLVPKLESFEVGTPHFGHTTAWSLISAPQLLQYIIKIIYCHPTPNLG